MKSTMWLRVFVVFVFQSCRAASVVPGRAHVVPGRAHVVPGRAHVVPGRAHVVPDPDRAHVVPDRAHIVLDRAHIVLDRAHIVPDRAHVVLDRAHVVLDRAHIVPDRAHVVLDPDRAHGLLVRTRRYNSGWIEELQMGNLKRECLEEKCSYEEAREVFEHTELTDEFWKMYTIPESCRSDPCQNGASCSPQASSYTCLCLPQFAGLNCELEVQAELDRCLLENGGCQHFCDEDLEGRRLSCRCADGYLLDADGRSCSVNESIACGMVPVLKGERKEQHLRIVGGNECPKGECPWQVLLVNKGKGFCGGVIYKPTWILTASHCLENTDVQFLKVVAGEHNVEVSEDTEQLVQVVEIIMHENYVTSTADNDIALLRLASPIVYTPYAVPACLPTRALANRELWAVRLHTVSGWGRRSENGPTSPILRRLKVPRIRTQDCVEHSGMAVTENMFCAGYLEGREDSCKGDSGGPLVTDYKKTAFLLGIVSWGKGCARPGSYGIYTRVSNYLEWIHNRTATPQQLKNSTEGS